MSYTILRNAKVQEDGTIKCQIAESNITPTFWSDYTLKKENLEAMFMSCLDGCVKLQSNCGNIYRLFKEIKQIKDEYKLFDKSLNSHLRDYTISREADKMLATWTTQKLLGQQPILCKRELLEKMEEYAKMLDKAIQERDAEFEQSNKVVIRSASMSKQLLYKGEKCDILIDPADNMYVCPRRLYNNQGVLDNSANEAICVGKYNSILMHILVDTTWMHEYPKYAQIMSEDIGLRTRYLKIIQDLSLNGYYIPVKVKQLKTSEDIKEQMAICYYAGQLSLEEVKQALSLLNLSCLSSTNANLLQHLVTFLHKDHESVNYEIMIAEGCFVWKIQRDLIHEGEWIEIECI